MFTTLVVPLDGSPLAATAVRPAAAIARRAFATVELVTVTSPGLGIVDDELMLKDAASELDGVAFNYRIIESNDAPEAIIAASADEGSVLCMATHGRTGLARVVLGSTADTIIRSAARPVILVGPHAAAPTSFEAILACVKTSSPESCSVVPTAVEMARTLGARLWLVEVQSGGDAAPPDAPPDVVEAGGLEALASHLIHSGVDVEWEVLHGDVVGEVLRARATLGAAMLAVTAWAGGGILRTTLGSVSTQLAHTAPCPVLVAPSLPLHR